MGEIYRAVNWIHDPEMRRIVRVIAAFFAQKSMVWIMVMNDLGSPCLAFDIKLQFDVMRAALNHLLPAAQVGERMTTRGAGCFDGDVQKILGQGVIHAVYAREITGHPYSAWFEGMQ